MAKRKKGPRLPINNNEELFDQINFVASTSESTGLMPTPATSDAQIESYADIYDMPLSKTSPNTPEITKSRTNPRKK